MTFSFYNMSPGDGLEDEIRRTCTGYTLKINLETARKLAQYNETYGENLTFGEFISAYRSNSLHETEKSTE